MASKFNLVKKQETIKTEEDEEDELEEERQAKANNQKAKKKMFVFMGVIVAVLVVLLLTLYIVSLFSKKVYTYDEIEKVIKDATMAYFKDHADQLPQADGAIVEIGVENLIAEERMRALTEYTKEGVSCTGYALVEKAGEEYLYTPYLNCGEEFETIELYKKILQEEEIKTTGYGLYNINGTYVYRGEEVNNYVELEKGLWRIVKINANTNNLVLIKEYGVGSPVPWDDRYNNDSSYASGINTYSASRIKEYIDRIYKEPNESLNEVMLGSSDKEKMVAYKLCVGKRGENETTNDGSIECSETLDNQRVGLLSAYDYINASTDPNCKAISNISCQNYNYLVEKYNWWLITADKALSYKAFNVNDNGRILSNNAIGYSYVRPVITINSKVLYKEGDGTKSNPYKLK